LSVASTIQTKFAQHHRGVNSAMAAQIYDEHYKSRSPEFQQRQQVANEKYARLKAEEAEDVRNRVALRFDKKTVSG
jgi:hypothetical protein